jgi:hypothetical protein
MIELRVVFTHLTSRISQGGKVTMRTLYNTSCAFTPSIIVWCALLQALVINAPAWFSYPWKLMNAFLDANTRCAAAAAAAAAAEMPAFVLFGLILHWRAISTRHCFARCQRAKGKVFLPIHSLTHWRQQES